VFEYNDNKVITFLGVEDSSNETLHQHLKMLFDEHKECELIVNICAFRDGKIDNIVNDAKQIHHKSLTFAF
jgi:hypothetical protein